MNSKDVVAWINGGWRSSPYAKQHNNGFGLDVDNLFGFQCKDLANAYGAWLGHPLSAGNANALWDWPQDGFYTKIGADQTPRVGDIFVSYYASGGIEYDHTGVIAGNISPAGFTSLDQNWFSSSLDFGSPPAMVNHDYSKIRGYLRPALKEDSMTIANRGDVESWYRELLFRDVDESGYASYVGQDYKWGYESVVASPEHVAKKAQLQNLQQERDTLYSIAEIRRGMLDADAATQAGLQKQLDQKQLDLTTIQADKTKLEQQIKDLAGNNIVISPSTWDKFFISVRDFFNKLRS